MKVKTMWTYNEMLEERRKTTKDCISFMMHLLCWCLHDVYGFGHDRLDNVLKWMDRRCADYMGENGEVKLADVHNMLIDECKINIAFDKERMK